MSDYHRYIPSTASILQAETFINLEESGGAVFDDSEIAYVGGQVANSVGFNVVAPAPKPFYLRKANDPVPVNSTKCWPSGATATGTMVLQGAITLVVGYRGT